MSENDTPIINILEFANDKDREQAKLFKEAAHVMKELYDSFIEAGFTTQESLYLIACLTRPNANKN